MTPRDSGLMRALVVDHSAPSHLSLREDRGRPARGRLQRLRRVASLVPPPRANLTRFHGVFAPGAKLRPFLLPLTEAEPKEKEASAPPEAAAKAEAKKEHMPRLDWAYAAAPDVRFGRLGLCRVWRQA